MLEPKRIEVTRCGERDDAMAERDAARRERDEAMEALREACAKLDLVAAENDLGMLAEEAAEYRKRGGIE